MNAEKPETVQVQVPAPVSARDHVAQAGHVPSLLPPRTGFGDLFRRWVR